MLQVSDFWAAIDRLAEQRALTLAQLAVRAGLPESQLLPENRVDENGVMRWPSLEMLIRIVEGAGISLAAFGRMLDDIQRRREAGEGRH